MKMLYILNQTSRINSFCMSSLLAAKALNIDFHIAGNWSYSSTAEQETDGKRLGVHIHQVDFYRNPIHPGNLRAYKQLNEIVQRESFDVLHCNTPVGGLIGRILGFKHKVKKVIYQAHGFHFYKGAPILNWILYYPAEKWMAHYTDELICINKDDYVFAKQHLNLRHGGEVRYIPGIGIDTQKYESTKVDADSKRIELGIPLNKPLILSVGELNHNKNHVTIINALVELPDVHYAIAGKGKLLNKLKSASERLGVADRVHFLGFRMDLHEIYRIAEVFCLPSKREGLCTSIMEAMASGLPVVCSDIRGNRDLIIQNEGGYLVASSNALEYAAAIRRLLQDKNGRTDMIDYNLNLIKRFSLDCIVEMMQAIYNNTYTAL